jgi:membrane protein implicated in regulation of membrane protease activity
METFKFYATGIINGMLLSAGFMDFLDYTVRIVSVIAGTVLSVYLIRKAQHDINSRKLDDQLKRMQIEKEHQELHEIMERNKKSKE